MKVIITGATGFIGGAVLGRAIAIEAITSIVTLSRRDLPASLAESPKVKNVIVKDFTSYSDDVLAELKGASACIWTLGGRASQFPDFETARKATVEYTHAGAAAMLKAVAPAGDAGKFRFVYCSGALAVRDQKEKLYFLEQTRKLKGESEAGLLELERQSPDALEVLIARPAGVVGSDSGVMNSLMGSMAVGKGALAAAMVDMAVKGADGQVLENNQLRARGLGLLKQG